MSGGDYAWSDMPTDLALLLKSLSTRLTPESTLKDAEELQEWLLNEMQHCAASKEMWPRLSHYCSDLPEVGSEFCKAHMPKGDVDARD